jgi:hypothetical protein
MAITNGPISRSLFIGLSGDTKPTGGIEFAAQFYEYDTGKTYIWTGSNVTAPAAGQWVEYIPLYPFTFDALTQNPLS